jgi:hypothetical protein
MDNWHGFLQLPDDVIMFSDVPSLFRSKSIVKVIDNSRTAFHASQLVWKSFTARLLCKCFLDLSSVPTKASTLALGPAYPAIH